MILVYERSQFELYACCTYSGRNFYEPIKSRAQAGIAVSRFAAATCGALCAVYAVCDSSYIVVLLHVSDQKATVSSAVIFWRFLGSVALGSLGA